MLIRMIGVGKLINGVLVIKAVDPATGKVRVYMKGGKGNGFRYVI